MSICFFFFFLLEQKTKFLGKKVQQQQQQETNENNNNQNVCLALKLVHFFFRLWLKTELAVMAFISRHWCIRLKNILLYMIAETYHSLDLCSNGWLICWWWSAPRGRILWAAYLLMICLFYSYPDQDTSWRHVHPPHHSRTMSAQCPQDCPCHALCWHGLWCTGKGMCSTHFSLCLSLPSLSLFLGMLFPFLHQVFVFFSQHMSLNGCLSICPTLPFFCFHLRCLVGEVWWKSWCTIPLSQAVFEVVMSVGCI